MQLRPITRSQFADLSPRRVTTSQWFSYWGTNKLERTQKILESVLLAYGGLWLSWFFSFMAGSFFSSLIGTMLIFNWMFTPWLNSNRNNRNAWYLDHKPLHHAFFRGRIVRLNKVKRRTNRTVGAPTQEFLDLIVSDEEGRELEIITPWEEQYHQLRLEMSINTIIASTSKEFADVVTLTDSHVPACDVWVGDYPYVNKTKFKQFVMRKFQDLTTSYENFNSLDINSVTMDNISEAKSDDEVIALANILDASFDNTYLES
eukprot:gene8026-10875_t